MPTCWLLDDTPDWHTVTAATLARLPAWHFVGFHHSRGVLAALAQEAPRVLLMDYFLHGERGDAVTRSILQAGVRQPGIIVAHSTTSTGNAAIRAAGARATVRKRGSREGINHELLAWLADLPP